MSFMSLDGTWPVPAQTNSGGEALILRQWPLHVSKPDPNCPTCKGTGEVVYQNISSGEKETDACLDCWELRLAPLEKETPAK